MAAEMMAFLVDVFNVGARSHDTGRDQAVYQSEGMPEFMDDHFAEEVKQQGFILLHAILFIPQAVYGCNARVALEGCLSENIREDGNEQVHTEQTDLFNKFSGVEGIDFFQ